MIAIDLIGTRFGRLVVLSPTERTTRWVARWLCRCDCGNEKIVIGLSLRNGKTRSCGCLIGEAARGRATHGHSRGGGSKTYKVWGNMRVRCHNPNNHAFKHYGGRGITVCERWRHSFENFLADMGERPPGLTLERKDNNAGYSPENCKWATRHEQNENTRTALRLTHNGVTKTINEWAAECGIRRSCLYSRINKGLTIEQAIARGKPLHD